VYLGAAVLEDHVHGKSCVTLLWKEFKRVSLLPIRDFFAAKHVSGSIHAAACPASLGKNNTSISFRCCMCLLGRCSAL
jgi:hypothetical protein